MFVDKRPYSMKILYGLLSYKTKYALKLVCINIYCFGGEGMIVFQDIIAAYEKMKGIVHMTPLDYSSTFSELSLETKGRNHIEEILSGLKKKGYAVEVID